MRKIVKFFVMLQRFVADTVASGKKKNRRMCDMLVIGCQLPECVPLNAWIIP